MEKVDHQDELILSNLGNEGDTDLQALARLYDDQAPGQDGYGVLNQDDAAWSMLKVWQGSNSDGVSDPGEVRSLDHADIGITEISLTYDDGTSFDDTCNDGNVYNNSLVGTASLVRSGQTVVGGVGDIALSYNLIAPEIRDTDYGFEARIEEAEDVGILKYLDLSLPGSSEDYIGSSYNGVYGDSRANIISASSATDSVILDGAAGNDHLVGGSGNDQLIGGEGADKISGGSGNDTIVADFLDLVSNAQAADEGVTTDGLVRGGSGFDTLIITGDRGVHTNLEQKDVELVYGSAGDDRLSASGNDDAITLYGEAGADRLVAGSGNDFLYGGDANDALYGGLGDDSVIGGTGNDYLRYDGGSDYIDGGSGTDTVSYWGLGSDVQVNLLQNTNSDGDTLLNIENIYGAETGNDTLFGDDSANVIKGLGGNDHLYGQDGNDLLYGNAGDDRLYGNNNNDKLYGGDGADYLDGGNGDDILTGGAGADVFRFDRHEENDVIKDFENNIDTIQLAGFGAFFETWEDLQSYVVDDGQTSGNVVFDFGNNNRLTIENIELGSLFNDVSFI